MLHGNFGFDLDLERAGDSTFLWPASGADGRARLHRHRRRPADRRPARHPAGGAPVHRCRPRCSPASASSATGRRPSSSASCWSSGSPSTCTSSRRSPRRRPSIGGILSDPVALVLPVATYAFVAFALWSRFMRSSVMDNIVQDYVRTARAKGASEQRVLWGHIFRNSLITIVTLLGPAAAGRHRRRDLHRSACSTIRAWGCCSSSRRSRLTSADAGDHGAHHAVHDSRQPACRHWLRHARPEGEVQPDGDDPASRDGR